MCAEKKKKVHRAFVYKRKREKGTGKVKRRRREENRNTCCPFVREKIEL